MIRMYVLRMMMTLTILLLNACQSLVISPISSHSCSADLPQADSHNVEVVGHIGGSALSIAVQGDYAFIGFSTEFVVLDISEPTAPRWIAALPIPSNAIVLQEQLAYIGGQAGLYVVDITDPRQPFAIGSLSFPVTITALAVAKDYGYVVSSMGLSVVDLNAPETIRQVGALDLRTTPRSVVLLGQHLYLSSNRGLYTIDVTDPRLPGVLAIHFAEDSVYGPAVADGFLYFFRQGQFGVVDSATPTQLHTVEAIDSMGWIGNMVVADDILYLVNSETLQRWRISDRTTPVQLDSYAVTGLAMALAVQDNFVYLVDCDEGLRIFDTTAEQALVEVGSFRTLGITYGAAVDGATAYVTAGFHEGLHWLDIRNHGQCHTIGFHLVQQHVTDFAVAGNYLYVTAVGGLSVYDRTAASDAQRIGYYPLPEALTVQLAGTYAYVGNGRGDLWVLDIATPTAPQLIAEYANLGYVSNLFVEQRTVYLPGRNGDLLLLEIESTGELRQVDTISVNAQISAIARHGDYLYVAAGSAGLMMIDTVNGAVPRVVAVHQMRGDLRDIVIDGDYAYVIAKKEGLYILDIAAPIAPREVGYYRSPSCTARSVAYANGLIYLANNFGGLTILRFTP